MLQTVLILHSAQQPQPVLDPFLTPTATLHPFYQFHLCFARAEGALNCCRMVKVNSQAGASWCLHQWHTGLGTSLQHLLVLLLCH